MVSWIKKSLISVAVLSALGCYVPGTYFSNEDISDGYYYEGKKVHISVTQLTPDWMAKYNQAPYEYKIGAYDILNIVVWDHPELTTVTTQQASPDQTGTLVDKDGYIYFPFVGKIKVGGLSFDQARALLEEKLAKYIQNPQVMVRVASFRSQSVQIITDNTALTQPITDKPLTALTAINGIGGASGDSKTVQIYILREESPWKLHVYWFNAQQPIQLIAAEHFYLLANDIVYVPSAGIANWNRVIGLLLPTAGAKTTVEDSVNPTS
jgi:protein involved in polysaccharide export with SLBB domain